MTCFACIFVPDFPAEALLRAEPDLRGQPVAVLAGKPPLEKVFAVNEKARRAGVEPGMTKIQLDAWTNVVLRPRSELQETAAHAALLDCAQSFSPYIEDTAPDTVLLDLEGAEHLFGSLPKIARDIARRASDLGLEVNVAASSNADAATLAARGFPGVTFIPEGQEAHRLGELPVSVLFEGLLSDDQQKDAERILDTLDRWGLRNLRSFAALPEIPLSERLGQEGLRLQRLARGTNPRTLKLMEPALIFEEAVELEFPIVLLEPLAFMMNRMLEQLCNRLAARALAAQELRLRFELATEYQAEESPDFPSAELDSTPTTGNFDLFEDGERPQGQKPAFLKTPTGQAASAEQLCFETNLEASRPPHGREKKTSSYTRTLHLPVPMLDARVFLKLLQLDLRAHPPGAPIIKIHLAMEPARPRAAQGGLFQPPFPEPEKLELTLARMSGIVGEGNVGAVELLDTHRPEAFRMQPFAPEEPGIKRPDDDAPSGAKARTLLEEHAVDLQTSLLKTGLAVEVISPAAVTAGEQCHAPITGLRLFRPAVRVEVAMREGAPVRLACSKRKELCGEIMWCAGPWRSSGDWWEHEGWARDEWDIALESESGFALYRLVRDHFNSRWVVEGSYD